MSLYYLSKRYRQHHNIRRSLTDSQEIISRRHNIKGRIKKFNAYIWHLRGMNVDESLIQMRFARSPKGFEFFSLIKNGQSNAINQFGLDPDHLIIHRLNCGRAKQPKILKHRGRDRHQFLKLRHSHLFCRIIENKEKSINSFKGNENKNQYLFTKTRPNNLIVID